MPMLSFEGETQAELVAKVKRWLASLEGEVKPLSPTETINASAELTKDALRIIASSAPGPIGQSEVVKGLTGLGYTLTDNSAKAMVDALDSLSNVTGGSLVKRMRDSSASTVFEMNQAMAKQLLKSLRPRRP